MAINDFQTLQSIVNRINIGVTILNEQNRVVFWNAFMVKHSGISAEDLVGKNLFDVFTYLPQQWLELKLRSVRLIQNYSFVSWTQKPYLFRFSHDSLMREQDIENMRQDCTFIPVKDAATGEIFVCITVHDMTDVVVSQLKLSEMCDINKTLEQMTNHDNLTSLTNRLYVERQIEQEFEKAQRYQNIFSLIFFDIDHFKKVNDTYGHLAGDDVLKNVAATVKGQSRSSDIIGRYGGEEFLALLPETNIENALMLAQRLKGSIEDLVTRHESTDIRITISIGVVQFRPDIKNHLQMIHEADIALYHSKKNGRNAVTQFKITGCEMDG